MLEKEDGGKYVLAQDSPTFEADLESMIQEVKPNIFIDYMGGEQSSKVFEKMPRDSILVIAGSFTN